MDAKAAVEQASAKIAQSVFMWARKTPFLYKVLNRNAFASLQYQERMLADTPRVDAYATALPTIIEKTDVVLDLGTGTGILAFLAAKCDPVVVHAVDHSEIIETAKKVANANGLDNIEFHRTHSSALQIDAKVDVLIHEQMGDYLFEERMVRNIVELRDRLLAPNGRIVPGRFEFFVEPVQLKDDFRVPYISDLSFYGIDYSTLAEERSKQPPDYLRLAEKPPAYGHFLCEPEAVRQIDLLTVTEEELQVRYLADRTVTNGGRLDGLCVWFRAYLGEASTIDTSPFTQDSSNWWIPLLRVGTHEEVRPGDRIEVSFEAADLEVPDTWKWSVRVGG